MACSCGRMRLSRAVAVGVMRAVTSLSRAREQLIVKEEEERIRLQSLEERMNTRNNKLAKGERTQ